MFAREGGNANVTTLLERRSRFLVLLANPDRRPAGVAERIGAALGGLDTGLRRTVTFDRGLRVHGLPCPGPQPERDELLLRPAQLPGRKVLSENANERLRRHSAQRCAGGAAGGRQHGCAGMGRLNATPRRCLDYRMPAEVLDGH